MASDSVSEEWDIVERSDVKITSCGRTPSMLARIAQKRGRRLYTTFRSWYSTDKCLASSEGQPAALTEKRPDYAKRFPSYTERSPPTHWGVITKEIDGKEVRIEQFMPPLIHPTDVPGKKRLLNTLMYQNKLATNTLEVKEDTSSEKEPILIPSKFDRRIIGCVCHPSDPQVRWMWVKKGVPKECDCGHWFMAVDEAPHPFALPSDAPAQSIEQSALDEQRSDVV